MDQYGNPITPATPNPATPPATNPQADFAPSTIQQSADGAVEITNIHHAAPVATEPPIASSVAPSLAAQGAASAAATAAGTQTPPVVQPASQPAAGDPGAAQPIANPTMQMPPQPFEMSPAATTTPLPDSPVAGQPMPANTPPAQAPNPVTQTPTNHGAQPAKTSNNLKKIKILVIAGALLLLFGGVGAFAFIKAQSNRPEAVTAQALAHTFAEKQTAVIGTIAVTSGSGSGNLNMSFKSDMVNSGYEFSLGVGSIKSDSFSVKDINLGVTARLVKKDAYFKIDNLKSGVDKVFDKAKETIGPEELKTFQPVKDKFDSLAEKIGDKWIKVPSDLITKSGFTCLTDSQVVTKADQKLITAAYKKTPFFTIKANHGTELLDGVKNNHYTMTFDQNKLDNFSNGLDKVTYVKNLDTCINKASGGDSSDADKSHAADSSTTKVGDVDYWITAKDRKFSRIKMPLSEKDSSDKAELDAKISYGALAKIEAPVDAMSWADFLAVLKQAESEIATPLGVVDDSGTLDELSQGVVNGLTTSIPNILSNR